MIRVVIDTNVVVAGILSPRGRPAQVLAAAGERFELVWTAAIVAECHRVLAGPKLRRLLRGREELARAIVTNLTAGAAMVSSEMLPVLRVVEADPDDDVLFATAIAGGAKKLVSGDAAVLAIRNFAGVLVVDVATFLAQLGEG